jgi:hypothetical protein
MERDGGASALGVSELLVGASLAHQLKPQLPEDFDDL